MTTAQLDILKNMILEKFDEDSINSKNISHAYWYSRLIELGITTTSGLFYYNKLIKIYEIVSTESDDDKQKKRKQNQQNLDKYQKEKKHKQEIQR